MPNYDELIYNKLTDIQALLVEWKNEDESRVCERLDEIEILIKQVADIYMGICPECKNGNSLTVAKGLTKRAIVCEVCKHEFIF